jgi:glycosyltransferase involved in cell wall biosynthesis
MHEKNLLIISNNFPNHNNSYVKEIFVKEQLKFLKNYFDNVYVISPVAYGLERLRKTSYHDYQYDNVKVFFPKYLNFPFLYYFGRSLWIFFEVKAIRALVKRENFTFNLIHAHFTWPSGAVAVKLKSLYVVPVVITEHTSDSFHHAVRKNDVYWKNTLSTADAIIRVRGGDISLFDRMNVQKDKIHIVPNGFDAEKFFPMPLLQCRNKLGLPKNKKILLNVGNLYDPVKGHKFFIEAIGHIVKVRQDILGLIIGSGYLEKQLSELIEELQLTPYIHLIGSKPHPEIPFWINACDIFVLPSLNEGNPTVMFEALGCGKPFVGSNVGGIPEIIISEDFGLLVRPEDSEDLSEKILTALDKDWDTKIIVDYAEQFTWQHICQKIKNVYDDVL